MLLAILLSTGKLISQVEQYTNSEIDSIFKTVSQFLEPNAIELDTFHYTKDTIGLKKKEKERILKEEILEDGKQNALFTIYKKTNLKNGYIDKNILADSIENYHNFDTYLLVNDDLDNFLEQGKSDPHLVDKYNLAGIKQNSLILKKHINDMIAERYSFYGFTNTSKQAIKSINVYHDNDYFMFSEKNKDRDYTGGFRFEITTDYLKMRAIKFAFNYDKILSYQSFFVGGEGYTPYIRFDTTALKADGVPFRFNEEQSYFDDYSVDTISNYLQVKQEKTDRPFASYQYIGRAKYRLHYRGHIRSKSYFKLGYIGKSLGRDIQAILHRDFLSKSLRVLNWDRQIANGGRLTFNIEHKFDFMLFSKGNTVFNSKKVDPTFQDCGYAHFYIPVEAAIGFANTHYGFGLGFATQYFIRTSGLNDISYSFKPIRDYDTKFKRYKYIGQYFSRLARHTNFFLELKSRHVIHNSMLHGFGWRKKLEVDRLDDEAFTPYWLTKDQTNNLLHMLNIGLNFRLKKMSIYYHQTRFLNKEFEKLENITGDQSNYTTPKFYGWGRLGVNVIL